jgi:hypothetical protein
MLSTSDLSTFVYSDPAFYALESALKSVASNSKRDSAPAKLKVTVGRSDIILKKSKTRKNLATNFTCTAKSAEQKPSQLCADIEYNFSTAINALGNCVWDVESPIFAKKSKDTEYEIDSNGRRKRFRRKPEDLESEKTHACPYSDCEKSYTSRCSLYLHIKRNHTETECVKPGETTPVRINSKVKKGVNIYKVFKFAQAQKYECGATNLSTANSLSDSETNQESPIKAPFFNRCRHAKSGHKSTQEFAQKKCEISKKKTHSAHCLVDLDFDVSCELAADGEIFSWENASDEMHRKISSTSIFVQDPIIEFENVVEGEGEESIYCQNFTFPYNVEFLEDNGAVVRDFCFTTEDDMCYRGVNESESANLARTFDFVDFSIRQEESDCGSLFDFEFQISETAEPRKALKC